MNKRILFAFGLAAVIMVAGCTPVGPGSTPIAPTTLDESQTLADASAADFVFIPANSTRSVRVDVDPMYGEQIIVMTEGSFLGAYAGSRHVASSSTPDRFISLEIIGLSADPATSIVPAISVNSPSDYQCIGPCVAVDSADEQGVLTIEMENSSSKGDLFPIYVVAAPYFDAREYDNDTRDSAFALSTTSSRGALETVFDEDWFFVGTGNGGSYDFRAPSAFDLQVLVYDGATVSVEFTVEAGTTRTELLLDDEYVELHGDEYAATAATSWYEISPTP